MCLGSDSAVELATWEQSGKAPTVARLVWSGGAGEHTPNSTPGSAPRAELSYLKITGAGIQDSCTHLESTLQGICTLLEQEMVTNQGSPQRWGTWL